MQLTLQPKAFFFTKSNKRHGWCLICSVKQGGLGDESLRRMNINILQTNIRWAEPEANRLVASRLMDCRPGADLWVLPEMWDTGFMTADRPPTGSRSQEWMAEEARRRDCAICGSLAVDAGSGKMANRLCFAYPDGRMVYYDKHHLFGYGGEDRFYQPGRERVIVEYGGLRFLLAVCYDLRFPVWLRNRGDYDGMIVVANWPASRRRVWDILLQARALENQCYVVAANRTGDDPACHYTGGSCIIDAKGRLLASDKGGEEVVSAQISQEELAAFRQKFPVLGDADDFALGLPASDAAQGQTR